MTGQMDSFEDIFSEDDEKDFSGLDAILGSGESADTSAFLASFGRKEALAAQPVGASGEIPRSNQPGDQREQWKTFVRSYREDYLIRLRTGFKCVLGMLEEMVTELQHEHGINPHELPEEEDTDY